MLEFFKIFLEEDSNESQGGDRGNNNFFSSH